MRWLVGQGARTSDSNPTSPFLFIYSELNPLPTFLDSTVPLSLGHQPLLHLQKSYTIYPVGLKSMMRPLQTWFPNEGRKEWSSESLFYMFPRVGHCIWPPEKSAFAAARYPSNLCWKSPVRGRRPWHQKTLVVSPQHLAFLCQYLENCSILSVIIVLLMHLLG